MLKLKENLVKKSWKKVDSQKLNFWKRKDFFFVFGKDE